MTNLMDFDRLSDHIGAITDKRLVAIATGISASTGYLRSLVTQSQGFANQASGYAGAAQVSAQDADTSATTSLTALNDFSSTYLGVSSTEPQVSSQGNSVNAGAFYIRSTDGRLRYVSTVNGSGVPTYNDATVTADPASLQSAGAGVFLSILTTSQQTVKGPVTFQAPVLGTRVTSWTTLQLTTAVDVNEKVQTVQQSVAAETTRATQAEAAITNAKVSKVGDIMSGALQIAAAADNAALILRNTTSGSGRAIRFKVQDNGILSLYDETSSVDRLLIRPTGEVSVPLAFSAGTTITSKNYVVNQTDTADAGLAIHKTDVPRWYVRRSDASQRFYISRMNAQGVYVDTPLLISEVDGSITLNRVTVNDTITASGAVNVNGTGASLILNNSSSGSDSVVHYRHNGVTRWSVGRSPLGQNFYFNRCNSSGVYVDTPISINESTGLITTGSLTSLYTIRALTSLITPIVYATASGTGRSIAIGDDAWIGDANIPNGFRIGGQNNIDAGFVQFGNSGVLLGCNANDNQLRYAGNVVYHAGNIDSAGVVRITSQNLSEQNGHTIYSTGKKECWGYVTIAANSTAVINLPVTHTAWVNIGLGPFTRNSSDAQDNTAILSKNGIASFTIANWEDVSMRCEWHSVGV